MILTKETLKRYAQSRIGTNTDLACHAPFTNLNFEQNGNARACCYNTSHILGKWPEQSIKEIWEGAMANELRDYISKNNMGGGCIECGKMIETGNHQGVRAKYYDEFAGGFFDNLKQKISGKVNLPRVMEFELSNECNLECVMCNGYFSSSIRKNREKLPPIQSPYNKSFVDELEFFLPHMTDAKFLGGEPFMIEIYLQIWERIRKVNPNMRIHVTTNGTFLNNRVKELLEGLRAGIILSIDSVNRDTYSKIRVNGNFDKVMENLEYFQDYTKRKRTFISIAACPITYNWMELPSLLEFCLKKNIALYFNAVFTPVELSLREQPVELLSEIVSYLDAYSIPKITDGKESPATLSVNAYRDFVSLLKGWLQERKSLLDEKEKRLHNIARDLIASDGTISKNSWSIEAVKSVLFQIVNNENKGFFDEHKTLQTQLAKLMLDTPPGEMMKTFEAFIELEEKYSKTQRTNDVQQKVYLVAQLIENHPGRNAILEQTALAPPLYFAQLIKEKDLQELETDLTRFFSQ